MNNNEIHPSRQKTFIIENASFLTDTVKHTILTIIMNNIGKEATLVDHYTGEISINLDIVEEKSKDDLFYIYNIVSNMRKLLDVPLK